MEKAIIVRGRLRDSNHIELEEPVDNFGEEVEVVLRSLSKPAPQVNFFDFIASLPPGTRTKEDIDKSLGLERSSWDDP